MKKKFNKKLVLSKVTVTSLNDNDMYLIRGATFVRICTESCSFVRICCDPYTNPLEENQHQDDRQG